MENKYGTLNLIKERSQDVTSWRNDNLEQKIAKFIFMYGEKTYLC